MQKRDFTKLSLNKKIKLFKKIQTFKIFIFFKKMQIIQSAFQGRVESGVAGFDGWSRPPPLIVNEEEGEGGGNPLNKIFDLIWL